MEIGVLYLPNAMLVLAELIVCSTRGFACILAKWFWPTVMSLSLKLQLHDAIYRLRFYSNLLIHILSLSNLHNNVAPIQKNRNDKSHRVIVALHMEVPRLHVISEPTHCEAKR